jgi:hypothetical protein
MADTSGRCSRGSCREVRERLACVGHRKIGAMMRSDGLEVSTSTVE